MILRALLTAAIFIGATLLSSETPCSANLAVQPSRSSPNRHQVILQAYINNAGPFAFLLDTGSQVTVIDESLASELHLQASTKATLVGLSLQGEGGKYALANSVRVGEKVKVDSLYVLTFDLNVLDAGRYAVRGIIGEDFLSQFDETIDNTHSRVCFTRVGQVDRPQKRPKIQ